MVFTKFASKLGLLLLLVPAMLFGMAGCGGKEEATEAAKVGYDNIMQLEANGNFDAIAQGTVEAMQSALETDGGFSFDEDQNMLQFGDIGIIFDGSAPASEGNAQLLNTLQGAFISEGSGIVDGDSGSFVFDVGDAKINVNMTKDPNGHWNGSVSLDGVGDANE